VAVASVSDPDLEEAVSLTEVTAAGLLRQAVAVEVIEARERVTARIAGLGAQVVEAPPQRLAAACVGAYLAARRRARL
jgi:hypothetical protein